MTLLFIGRPAEMPEQLKIVHEHRAVFDNGDLVCPPPNHRTKVVAGVSLRQSTTAGNVVITKDRLQTEWVMRDPQRQVIIKTF